jgi:type VI protein secretion system component VasA
VARLVAVVLTLIIVLITWLLFVYPAAPQSYRLMVHNNTTVTIDTVRVFGSGSVADAVVTDLEPGESGELELLLNVTGQLRFEVLRGYNRIDAIFEGDVSSLDRHQQWLLLNKNNLFILSDTAPAVRSRQ